MSAFPAAFLWHRPFLNASYLPLNEWNDTKLLFQHAVGLIKTAVSSSAILSLWSMWLRTATHTLFQSVTQPRERERDGPDSSVFVSKIRSWNGELTVCSGIVHYPNYNNTKHSSSVHAPAHIPQDHFMPAQSSYFWLRLRSFS